MQAVSRVNIVHTHPPFSRSRKFSTKSIPSHIKQKALEEIEYHKLIVTAERRYTNNVSNFYTVSAEYGICAQEPTARGCIIAQITNRSKYSWISPVARQAIPNLLHYLHLATGDTSVESLVGCSTALLFAKHKWQIKEISQMDPGHFSKYRASVTTSHGDRQLISYYEMCIRIGALLAYDQVKNGFLGISLDKLHYGPLHWGTIYKNEGIKVSESFSEIVTPLGTIFTGNPSYIMNPQIAELTKRLEITKQSVTRDLDCIRRPICSRAPSRISRKKAQQIWNNIRDEVLLTACKQVKEEMIKSPRMEGKDP